MGYYKSGRADRQRELDLCLAQNVGNPYLARIHLLLEDIEADPRPELPASWAEKLTIVVVGRRPTFADAFRYAGQYLAGQICILANADIFFDQTLARLFPPAAAGLQNRVRNSEPP